MAMQGQSVEVPSPQDDVVFTMRKALNGEWKNSTGATFKIVIGPNLEASCVCTDLNSPTGESNFLLWCDDSYQYLWFGMKGVSSGFPIPGLQPANMKNLRASATFADLRDVLADANKISWYAGTDWQKTRPIHFWVRSDCTTCISMQAVAKHVSEQHTAMLAASAFRSYQPPSISAPPGLDPPPSFVLRLDSYLHQIEKPTSAKSGKDGDHSESDTVVGSSTSENDTDENDASENDIGAQYPLGDAPRTKLRSDANFFVPRPVVHAKLELALGLDDEPRTERIATPCGKDSDKSASGTSVGSSASDSSDTNEDSLASTDTAVQSNSGTEANQVQRTKLRAGAKRFVPMPMAAMGW